MGWERTSTRLESEWRSDHLRFRSYGRVWAWTDIWEEQEEKDMRGTYGGRPRFASPTIPTVGCTLASRRAYDLAGFLKTTLCFRRKYRRIDVCRLWHSHLAFCSLQPLPCHDLCEASTPLAEHGSQSAMPRCRILLDMQEVRTFSESARISGCI